MPGLSPKNEWLAGLILISICGFLIATRLPDKRASLYTVGFSVVFTGLALLIGVLVIR